jgi:hypothetical protein
MKVIASMMFSVCVQLQQSGRVPSLGALLVACFSSRQAALEAVSCRLSEKSENGSFTSFPYDTTGDRNIPPKQTRIKIWANNPPPQNKYLPSQRNYHHCSSLLRWSPTHKRFLHASTPERRTRARAHTFDHQTNVRGPRTQNISFKKTLAYRKRWVTMRAVPQVNRTALNTLLLVGLLVLR